MRVAVLTTLVLIAFSQARPVNSMPASSSHFPHSSEHSSASQQQEALFQNTDRSAIFKQAHEQLLQLARLEQERLQQARQDKKLLKSKGVSKRKQKSQVVSSSEKPTKWQIRKMKQPLAIALGLNKDSTLPNFAHRLTTVEQLYNHADFSDWQKLQRGLSGLKSISNQELPLPFKSHRGTFRFRESVEKEQNVLYLTSAKERLYNEKRRDKRRHLGLQTHSPLPRFVLGLSLDKVKNHQDIDSWQDYRRKLEKGIITEKEFPLKFQSMNQNLRLQKFVRGKNRPKTGILERVQAIQASPRHPSQDELDWSFLTEQLNHNHMDSMGEAETTHDMIEKTT